MSQKQGPRKSSAGSKSFQRSTRSSVSINVQQEHRYNLRRHTPHVSVEVIVIDGSDSAQDTDDDNDVDEVKDNNVQYDIEDGRHVVKDEEQEDEEEVDVYESSQQSLRRNPSRAHRIALSFDDDEEEEEEEEDVPVANAPADDEDEDEDTDEDDRCMRYPLVRSSISVKVLCSAVPDNILPPYDDHAPSMAEAARRHIVKLTEHQAVADAKAEENKKLLAECDIIKEKKARKKETPKKKKMNKKQMAAYLRSNPPSVIDAAPVVPAVVIHDNSAPISSLIIREVNGSCPAELAAAALEEPVDLIGLESRRTAEYKAQLTRHVTFQTQTKNYARLVRNVSCKPSCSKCDLREGSFAERCAYTILHAVKAGGTLVDNYLGCVSNTTSFHSGGKRVKLLTSYRTIDDKIVTHAEVTGQYSLPHVALAALYEPVVCCHDGMTVDCCHSCHNAACINPFHLSLNFKTVNESQKNCVSYYRNNCGDVEKLCQHVPTCHSYHDLRMEYNAKHGIREFEFAELFTEVLWRHALLRNRNAVHLRPVSAAIKDISEEVSKIIEKHSSLFNNPYAWEVNPLIAISILKPYVLAAQPNPIGALNLEIEDGFISDVDDVNEDHDFSG